MEAGAQGEHKIQRGYLPVATYSCHYILNDGFRNVIEDFLEYETDQVLLLFSRLYDYLIFLSVFIFLFSFFFFSMDIIVVGGHH